MLDKTLVCLDGSKLAEEILPYIIESGPVCRSEVILLHVITSRITIPPPESMHIMTFGRSSKPDRNLVSDMGETATVEPKAGNQLKNIEKEHLEANRYLERVARKLQDKGLRVKIVVAQGDDSDTILSYAENNKISLIALTTNGHGGMQRRVPGRVAQSILKETDIPVLLVKPRSQ